MPTEAAAWRHDLSRARWKQVRPSVASGLLQTDSALSGPLAPPAPTAARGAFSLLRQERRECKKTPAPAPRWRAEPVPHRSRLRHGNVDCHPGPPGAFDCLPVVGGLSWPCPHCPGTVDAVQLETWELSPLASLSLLSST